MNLEGFDREKTIASINHMMEVFLNDEDICNLCSWIVDCVDKKKVAPEEIKA